jgi:hypothetical protein
VWPAVFLTGKYRTGLYHKNAEVIKHLKGKKPGIVIIPGFFCGSSPPVFSRTELQSASQLFILVIIPPVLMP